VSLTGSRLNFDDMDSSIGGSRLRGHLAVTLDGERSVEGEVGLDTLDLAPAFALAMGAAGHDATEPLGGGLLKGWRGRIAFQALRGQLPGGAELRPVSGTVKSDGQALTFDALKGGLGGGDASATIDARPGANGITVNARVQLANVDGAALRYRSLAMPAGRVSLQMTLASQGRSASALTGALSGSGTVTLEQARLGGLDPRAFDVAIRASDNGQATDDAKLRQIVDAALSGGALSVKSALVPFSVGDGRLRVGATTLEADGARAIISGGYDIPADQTDIRVSLISMAAGQGTSRPEIQLFTVGSSDALNRTTDVASLSSWLAVRAIDRETRRLDSIERGEPQPPATPASLPPPTAAPPVAATPELSPSEQPSSDGPMPGHDPRRLQLKPKPGIPRPPAAALPASPAVPSAPNTPVASQQLAPLPPPIEVRPPPGAVVRPKPKPPLVLTPSVANPQRPAF
jgi:large subunit ribosomal protein L24